MSLGTPRCRWESNFKFIVRKDDVRMLTQFVLFGLGIRAFVNMALSFVNTVISFVKNYNIVCKYGKTVSGFHNILCE